MEGLIGLKNDRFFSLTDDVDHEGGEDHPPAPASIRRADTCDALSLLLLDCHQRLLPSLCLLPSSCLCWRVTITGEAGNLGAEGSLIGSRHLSQVERLDHAGLVSWAVPMPWGLCPLERSCVGEGGRVVTIEEIPRLRESREAATDVNTQRRRRRGRRTRRVTRRRRRGRTRRVTL